MSTKSLTQGDKFCKAMSVLKTIAASMASQSAATYEMMFKFLTTIEPVFRRGEVPQLAPSGVEWEIECAPGYQPPSESSKPASMGAQPALVGAQPASVGAQPSLVSRRPTLVSRKTTSVGDKATSVSGQPASASQRDQGKDQDEDVVESVARVDTSFKLPTNSKFSGARRDIRAGDAGDRMKAVLREGDKFMLKACRKVQSLTLADVQEVIETASYSYFDAIPVMCGIPIINTDTKTSIVQRRDEHVIADYGSVRFVLEEPVLVPLLKELKNDEDDSESHAANERVVAVDDGRGFLSLQHLKTMDVFMDAMARVNQVVIATEWVYRKQNKTARVEFPFAQFGPRSRRYVEDTVEAIHNMPLGRVSHVLDSTLGCDVLDIVSGEWLHTTSILTILTCILKIKTRVGVLRPEFVHMKDPEQRWRVMSSHYAFNADTDFIVAILNLEKNHWCSLFIDKARSECTLFDPLHGPQHGARIKRLENLVEHNVQPLLPNRLDYQTFTLLHQDDSSSCGVYAALFLELMLCNAHTGLAYPASTELFQMRYMRMVATMLRTQDSAVSI